jgi:hypothetical protein
MIATKVFLFNNYAIIVNEKDNKKSGLWEKGETKERYEYLNEHMIYNGITQDDPPQVY